MIGREKMVRVAAATLFLVAIMAATLFAGSKEADAAEVSYFYCFAPDPDSGTTFVSDVHPVGPVSERRLYSQQFADYLREKGLTGGGRRAFCTMRATMIEITRGRMALAKHECLECSGAEKMADVAWARGSPPIEAELVSTKPKRESPDNVAQAESRAHDEPGPDNPQVNENEAAQILQFFFKSLPPKIDVNDRKFAQRLILESARRSEEMSYAEALLRSTISPNAKPDAVIWAIAKRVLRNLAEPDTVQAAINTNHYWIVVNQVRANWRSSWEDRLQNDDSAMLLSL